MKLKLIASLLLVMSLSLAKAQRIPADEFKSKDKILSVQPLAHATFVLSYDSKSIYVDPTGGAKTFAGLKAPNYILITDVHGDHLDTATINAVSTPTTTFVVPKAVAEKLPPSVSKQKIVVLNNGEAKQISGISFAAIPMYNLPETADSRHPKGRGNGYILTVGNKRIYISGDTEDTPEMRSLKNIDIAFVCMNLPYTMDVKQASQGVLAFKPKVVYPYHYKGQDTKTFKSLVEAGHKNIDVRLRNWYN